MDNQKSSPKDFFLHLASIIALYASAGSLISLLFDYINIIFPDALRPYYYEAAAGSIRSAMASLIIIFPLYILISWLLNKDYVVNPEKRELKIRKWLIYFTLFIGAVIIAGDLVTLVYNFLGGDLTARFILKILIILFVVGAIFIYYFKDLKKSLSLSSLKILSWTVSVIILLSVSAGFFTAGSPFKARLYRFDQNKVSNLQTLQSEIINFWISKNTLPKKLEDLKNDITGFSPPVDSQNGQAYEYKVTGALTFELCANFNLLSRQTSQQNIVPIEKPQGYDIYQQNWNHDKGKQCFVRKIDPDFYLKNKQKD